MSNPDHDIPTVSLGGKEWPIPPLSARRIIRFGALATSVVRISNQMPEADMLRIYEAIYVGVAQGFTNGNGMTFDEWLDRYHVVFPEIIEALPIISRQAGMEFGKAEVALGEARAEPSAGLPSSSAGTTS